MAQSPFLKDPTSPINSEVLGLERQKKLAEMLLQRGMQTPQGQMVSGRYVAPAWTQYLANAFDAYGGGQSLKDVEMKQAQLAQRLKASQANEAQSIMQALQGTPEQTVYGAGMEGPTMNVTPAVEGSTQAALAQALKGESPFSQTMAAKLMEQQFKEPKWEKVEKYDPKTGNTITGMVNVNSPNPQDTFREVAVSKPALSAKDRAELADKGITIPVGAPVSGGVSMGGGMPMGGGQVKPVGDAKYMPSTLPVFEPDPSLSPAQNRELQAKFAEEMRKNVKNAKESFDTLKSASQILSSGMPSSGRLENIATGVKEFFGSESEQAKADSKLTILAQKLTGQVPRFEGPQSNVDVAMYQAAAGDLGNPNKTIGARLAAAQTLIDLNKKYYPNGDWDTIDLGGPVTSRQTLLKGEKRFDPVTFRQGLKPQDQEAFDWSRRNPTDPRAKEINKKLGIQ